MRFLSSIRNTSQGSSSKALKTENSSSNEAISRPIPVFGQLSVGLVLFVTLLFSGSASAMADGFVLPALPYAENALLPYIDQQTMRLHHTKHHQGYVTNLNAALENAPGLKKLSLTDLIQLVGTNKVPSDIATAVRNHGGGHWNHSFFWKIMSPRSGRPSGALADAIKEQFGSVMEFKDQFSSAATEVFGSGWAWLVVTPNGDLAITTTPNQDNPLMADASLKGIPVIAIDVWEHAYYLRRKNRRSGYVANWLNVINWDQAARNYADAKAGKVTA